MRFYNSVLTLVFILCVAASGGVGFITYQAIVDSSAMYRSEGECIAELISDGVERRHIEAINGTCWIKEVTDE